MNAEHSGQHAIPPAATPVTLNGVMGNPVVKLLAGLLLGIALAYNALVVTRIDNRIEALEDGQAKDDTRLDALEKYQAVHVDFHAREEKAQESAVNQWRDDTAKRDRAHGADRKVWLEAMRATRPKGRR